MSDAPMRSGCLRKTLFSLLILLIIVSAYIYWRQGTLDIEVDEARLAQIAASSNAKPGAPTEFTICTYNVQARPWFDDAEHKFQFISPLMNNHDIVAFQECFKQHDLLFAKSEHPVKIYHGTFYHPFKIVGSGLAMVANYPLVKVESKNYDALGEFQNWPASKGLLMGRFDMNGLTLDVYTTHIEAGGSPEALQAKIGQGDEIIEFVQKHSPPEHSVILLGDFNMRPSLNPEDKEKHKDNPRVFTFDKIMDELALKDVDFEINGPVRDLIDRILFREGTGHELLPLTWQHDAPEYYDPAGKPLSDHEPVFAKFRISPKGNVPPPAPAQAEAPADAAAPVS